LIEVPPPGHRDRAHFVLAEVGGNRLLDRPIVLYDEDFRPGIVLARRDRIVSTGDAIPIPGWAALFAHHHRWKNLRYEQRRSRSAPFTCDKTHKRSINPPMCKKILDVTILHAISSIFIRITVLFMTSISIFYMA
jgi:hypothetical protein